MEQAVLTFLTMAPNYGREAWTIQSDPGISEKGDSYSNMTSHHRFNLRSFGMLRKICHGFLKQALSGFVWFGFFKAKKEGSRRTLKNFSLSLTLFFSFFFFFPDVAAKHLSAL